METLSDLLSFLRELNITPKKGLSQNFLVDGNMVQKIVRTAQIQKGDPVLEIGPGPGHLTKELLEAGAIVYAIEKDPILAKALHRLQTEDQRLHIYPADALQFPLHTLPYQKVVANLPYQITTPLLERLFEGSRPHSLTLMVQKEVADRIFATHETKAFGLLSLFAQSHATLESRFLVPPQLFYPKPSVDSTVIHLKLRPSPLIQKKDFLILRAAFQQRRKMLSSSLKGIYLPNELKKHLLSLNLREDARPEMLSLNQWILFLKKLNQCMLQVDESTCRNTQESWKA